MRNLRGILEIGPVADEDVGWLDPHRRVALFDQDSVDIRFHAVPVAVRYDKMHPVRFGKPGLVGNVAENQVRVEILGGLVMDAKTVCPVIAVVELHREISPVIARGIVGILRRIVFSPHEHHRTLVFSGLKQSGERTAHRKRPRLAAGRELLRECSARPIIHVRRRKRLAARPRNVNYRLRRGYRGCITVGRQMIGVAGRILACIADIVKRPMRNRRRQSRECVLLHDLAAEFRRNLRRALAAPEHLEVVEIAGEPSPGAPAEMQPALGADILRQHLLADFPPVEITGDCLRFTTGIGHRHHVPTPVVKISFVYCAGEAIIGIRILDVASCGPPCGKVEVRFRGDVHLEGDQLVVVARPEIKDSMATVVDIPELHVFIRLHPHGRGKGVRLGIEGVGLVVVDRRCGVMVQPYAATAVPPLTEFARRRAIRNGCHVGVVVAVVEFGRNARHRIGKTVLEIKTVVRCGLDGVRRRRTEDLERAGIDFRLPGQRVRSRKDKRIASVFLEIAAARDTGAIALLSLIAARDHKLIPGENIDSAGSSGTRQRRNRLIVRQRQHAGTLDLDVGRCGERHSGILEIGVPERNVAFESLERIRVNVRQNVAAGDLDIAGISIDRVLREIAGMQSIAA